MSFKSGLGLFLDDTVAVGNKTSDIENQKEGQEEKKGGIIKNAIGKKNTEEK